jgi:hypothetical protein
MIPLYTQTEYNNAKSIDKLLCECYVCHKPFLAEKRSINYSLKKTRNTCLFCSKKCRKINDTTSLLVNCLQCGVEFTKILSETKRHPNHFCTQSCAATYSNTHKTNGSRRSKLEILLEQQLTQLYPLLDIDYNQKSAINSELDIYIPSLNLAIELNGIFHYEPIYGVNKLNQIKNNDISKSKACHEVKIDLCTIDVSQQSYFKPSTSQKYLDIIINIIKERLLTF